MPVLSSETKQFIKDTIDVEHLLKKIGFQIFKSTGSEVRAPCKIHGGDNQTAFSIRLDNKTWRCFTKHCEQDSSGGVSNDLFSLVMKVNGCSFMEAVRFLLDISGLNYDPETMLVEVDYIFKRGREHASYLRRATEMARRTKSIRGPSEECVFSSCKEVDDYFLKYGFREETLRVFEIGSKIDKRGVKRATIPIRDAENRLVGLSARRIDGDIEPRYELEFGFQKGRVLYGLNLALRGKVETMILVEGFKALWAVYEAGFTNVAACMGSIITNEQVALLCIYGVRNCFVMFDGDKAGIEGTVLSLDKLSKSFNAFPLCLPESVSPDDLKRDELKELISVYLLTI